MPFTLRCVVNEPLGMGVNATKKDISAHLYSVPRLSSSRTTVFLYTAVVLKPTHDDIWSQVIELSVTSLDVEPDEDEDEDDGQSCSYDCLQLFDGDDVHSQPLTAQLCGQVAPATTFLTSSNAACVHFRSDYFTAGTGFQIDYHVAVSQLYVQSQRRSGTKLQFHVFYECRCFLIAQSVGT